MQFVIPELVVRVKVPKLNSSFKVPLWSGMMNSSHSREMV